jgi:L-alanine-DL-glutamate epimerase-like enolase superfamily enzyme
MIERINVYAMRPDVERFSWADTLPDQYMTATIVRVFDDSGSEGVGTTPSYSRSAVDLGVYEALRVLAPRVLGSGLLRQESLGPALDDLTLPVLPGAVSALDIALWDASARRLGVPLYQLIGGARESLLAYASTPLLAGVDEYVRLVGELRDQGFRAVKFHAWCDPLRDLEMLRAVHRVHGQSGIAMMFDAEQRYDRASALVVGRELEAMGFRWFEAPLADLDIQGYRDLRGRVGIPILAGGNTILDPRQVWEALARRPWDALRFDATIAGGITAGRRLVAVAEAAGLWAELQSWGFTLIQAPNLHLGLGMRGTGWFEMPVPADPYEFAVTNPIRIRADGSVVAPDGPGLGLAIDWDRVDSATIARFSCSAASPQPVETLRATG